MESRQQLVLSDRPISDIELTDLLKDLQSGRYQAGLEILFNHNHFTDPHFEPFIHALLQGTFPPNLALSFASNCIGDHGLMTLVDALAPADRPRCITFDFRHNPGITNVGIRYLANAIKNNRLADGVAFNFTANPLISTESARELVESLLKNTAVHNLWIDTHDNGVVDNFFAIDGVRRKQPNPGHYQAIIHYCCWRNQLLHDYRDNSDLTYYILQLSQEAGFPCHQAPPPSLRFLAYQAAKPTQPQSWSFFGKPNPTSDYAMEQLAAGIERITDILGQPNKKSAKTCPCLIL
jgi:hypothetical protein